MNGNILYYSFMSGLYLSSLYKMFFFAGRRGVMGFELRTYTFSHSTRLIFVVGFFEIGSHGSICPG
jgi:hypothetical protein